MSKIPDNTDPNDFIYDPKVDGPWNFADEKFKPIAEAMHADLYEAVMMFAREKTEDVSHKLFELTDMEENDFHLSTKGASISVALMMLRQSLVCLKATDFPLDPTLDLMDREHPMLMHRLTELTLESIDKLIEKKKKRRKKRKKKAKKAST